MAKRHWYNGLGGACKVPRSLLGWWYEIKPRDFLDRHTIDPDRYCSDCTKAARLALAKESAPKPDAVVWPKPRPISEAPRDGTMVLICLPDSNPQWTMGVFARTHWVDLCLATAVVEPTHFLPLPPEVKE